MDSRIQYGMVDDIFDLAATYAVVVAVGHVFNDANKRTSFIVMDTCLQKNGIKLRYGTESIGQTIIKVAQGQMDEVERASALFTASG